VSPNRDRFFAEIYFRVGLSRFTWRFLPGTPNSEDVEAWGSRLSGRVRFFGFIFVFLLLANFREALFFLLFSRSVT
jgi:hypothetical protein